MLDGRSLSSMKWPVPSAVAVLIRALDLLADGRPRHAEAAGEQSLGYVIATRTVFRSTKVSLLSSARFTS